VLLEIVHDPSDGIRVDFKDIAELVNACIFGLAEGRSLSRIKGTLVCERTESATIILYLLTISSLHTCELVYHAN
jgi:hypothetical protein